LYTTQTRLIHYTHDNAGFGIIIGYYHNRSFGVEGSEPFYVGSHSPRIHHPVVDENIAGVRNLNLDVGTGLVRV
jgi:hypothetical protein